MRMVGKELECGLGGVESLGEDCERVGGAVRAERWERGDWAEEITA